MATRFRFYALPGLVGMGALVMPLPTADWGNTATLPSPSARTQPMKPVSRVWVANIIRSTTVINFAAAINVLQWQFVSEPIAAQNITGNIKGQCVAREALDTANCCFQFKAYVIQNDGFTVRGVLLGVDNSALSSEFATSPTNRKIPRAWTGSGVAVSPVAAQDGDRLVFEVGFRASPGDNANHGNVDTAFGGPLAAAQDLPEDETTVDTFTYQGYNPWIEISDDLTFLSLAGGGTSADGNAFKVTGQVAGVVLPRDPFRGIPNRGVESSQGGGGLADFIQQRVYDSGAGWCYYAKTFSDPLPAPSETQPNHTNSLVPGSHQLLGTRVTD